MTGFSPPPPPISPPMCLFILTYFPICPQRIIDKNNNYKIYQGLIAINPIYDRDLCVLS